MKFKFIALVMIGLCTLIKTRAQSTLHLPDALQTAVQQYEKIKSKKVIQNAAEQNIQLQKDNYLPDFTLGAQQNHGTINAQNGPLYSYGGLGAASTSMPLREQNWNAAFGSLYFANINWNFFTFGKVKNRINIAVSEEKISEADLQQETFEHQVKVAAAYLNLLAAQRVKYVQERNWERAKVFLKTTDALTASGLIPGVNASLAKAEVSNAQSARIKAYDRELEYAKTLSILMGDEYQMYQLDTMFHHKIPSSTYPHDRFDLTKHPSIVFQKAKIDKSNDEIKLIRSQALPNFSFFGVLQGRGSGFEYNYVQYNAAYSKSYLDGVGIQRGNYLLGLSLNWNLTSLYRNRSSLKSQQFLTQSLQHQYNLLQQELSAQAKLAADKIKNATENYEETKIQLQAASDAFRQNNALYNNGLTTILDWTQSLYTLNRAEVDFEIAQNNVWQALLVKAAAHGDINIILSAIQ